MANLTNSQRLALRIVTALLAFVIGVAAAKVMLVLLALTVKQEVSHNAIEEVQLPRPPSDTSSPVSETTEPKLKSLSPYEIEAYIDENPQADVSDIWRRLGIRYENLGLGHFTDEDQFFSSCRGCEAEIFTYEFNGKAGSEVLLRVSDRLQEACRYLIFEELNARSAKDGWKLLGHIDHAFGRYRIPQHYFVASQGKTWLVVQGQAGSGSGFALYYDRLFRFDGDKMKEVLSYPSEGHLSGVVGYEPSREFAARILSCESKNGIETVMIEFTLSYSGYVEDSDVSNVLLWDKRQKAVYIKQPGSRNYVLDESKSDLSEKEIKAIYAGEGLSADSTLKYNYDELVKIATGKNSKSRKWLRGFLKEYGHTPETKVLRQMMLR